MSEILFRDIRINGVWNMFKKIGSGSFGQVFTALNVNTNELAAVKLEETKKNEQLAFESKVIKALEGGTGIPRLFWYGTDSSINQYIIMIIDMLGPSQEDLYVMCKRKFSLKTVLMLADQMLSRIEFVHSRHYIHRDMKPDNFLMGLNKKSNIVYQIDFGLAKKYRDPKTQHHVPYKENKNLTGTARYASVHSHQGIEQSRRDDLESIGYLLIYFLKGGQPWQKMKANNKQEKYHKIMEKKMSTPIEVMCRGLPIEVTSFLNYTRTLRFEDKPDYSFQRKLFRELFLKEKYELDFLYDWTIADNINLNHRVPSNKLQIVQSLNKDINASDLMKEHVVDSIFKKPNGNSDLNGNDGEKHGELNGNKDGIDPNSSIPLRIEEEGEEIENGK